MCPVSEIYDCDGLNLKKKTGCSGGKTNGTVHPNGNFPNKILPSEVLTSPRFYQNEGIFVRITILSFFRLFLRRQYNYVLTSQKRASDWLKISRRFCWAPSIQNRNSKFLAKNGQKCKLLRRLKDKGKRYSTLESMLSKRRGKTRIKTCSFFFTFFY